MIFNSFRESVIWAAGLFEGEGCLTKPTARRHIITCLVTTDEDVMRTFMSVVGVGTMSILDSLNPRWKTQYRWKTNSFEDTQHVIALFYPFLHRRRKDRAREILLLHHVDEPESIQLRKNRTESIKKDILALVDKPLYGRRWLSGDTQSSIARRHGVSDATVSLIKTGMGL